MQHGDGDAANRSAAAENGAVPAEVPAPFVAARVEERSQLTGARVQSGEVRTLVGIAPKSAQREIASDGGPTVFPRDDVVDLKWDPVVILRHLAVFAATVCPLPNLPDKGCIHVAPQEAGRFFRSIPRTRQALT